MNASSLPLSQAAPASLSVGLEGLTDGRTTAHPQQTKTPCEEQVYIKGARKANCEGEKLFIRLTGTESTFSRLGRERMDRAGEEQDSLTDGTFRLVYIVSVSVCLSVNRWG